MPPTVTYLYPYTLSVSLPCLYLYTLSPHMFMLLLDDNIWFCFVICNYNPGRPLYVKGYTVWYILTTPIYFHFIPDLLLSVTPPLADLNRSSVQCIYTGTETRSRQLIHVFLDDTTLTLASVAKTRLWDRHTIKIEVK